MSAPYNPPKKNEDFIWRIQLQDMATPGKFKVNPTIASGDFKIDKDGGGLADLNTLPSVDPSGTTWVKITLSSTEMNADIVSVQAIDQTTLTEWADWGICILTTT